jgi:hypothetical protein
MKSVEGAQKEKDEEDKMSIESKGSRKLHSV